MLLVAVAMARPSTTSAAVCCPSVAVWTTCFSSTSSTSSPASTSSQRSTLPSFQLVPRQDLLSQAQHAMTVAPMANVHSLLTLSAYLSSLMQSLQIGHTSLVTDQQRENKSARCASCRKPLSASHVSLQCTHAVCYRCMLCQVSMVGPSCALCGVHNSMAQLRIDTLKSALTLVTAQPEQRQAEESDYTALRVNQESPQAPPPATPPSPMTPQTAAAAMELAMGHASAEQAAPTMLGYGSLLLSNGLGRGSLEAMRPFKRAASYSLLSHSASTSSMSSSTFSSLSPDPSVSPVSPPRFVHSHNRRSSVPNLLSVNSSSPSSSSSKAASSDERRPLSRNRSNSARKLSDSFSAVVPTMAGRVVAVTSLGHHTPPRGTSPHTPSSSQSSTRSSPVPLMATVIEPRYAAYLPPASVESRVDLTSLSSCHQCKSAKPRNCLMLCSSPAERTANRQRRCRKKYCSACLHRCYNWPFVAGVMHWTCPACAGLCTCASCQRGREQRRTAEAAEQTEAADTAVDIAAAVDTQD